MSQDLSSAYPFARVLSFACALSASACAIDTVVYEQRSDTAERPDRDAGRSAEAGGATADPPSPIYGCGVAVGAGGAPAIIQVIVGSASEASEWIRPDRNCREDRDCRSALLTPSCNVGSTLCTPCPEPGERIAYLGELGSCLTAAIAVCCADPDAEPDCVFRRCQSGCGPQ